MSDDPIASVNLSAPDPGEPEGMRWSPEPRSEIGALLAQKLEGQPTAQATVAASARAILGRGVPPGDQGSDTGLVVGRVQSGKTLSFTAVMALARDNGFQLVIVIAGTSTQLTDQSEKRVRKDLRVGSDGRRAWAPYTNPKVASAAGIDGLLDVWRDDAIPREQCQTVLITVMKQHTHLRNLAQVLGGIDLTGISALIIDDEADQASLNTQAQQNSNLRRARQSSTYKRLMELRRALPSHTYLQYTATPQAPLLISIIDSLSARWVEVLEPGNGYTGGVTFFGPPTPQRGDPELPPRPVQHEKIVHVIPAAEIPTNQNPLASAPATLQHALRLFMVGVAAGFVKGESSSGNRSMLVHPSVRTADHQTYWTWINDLVGEWRSIFKRRDAAADELAETFKDAYDELAETVGEDMPPFDDVKRRFRQAFSDTATVEVNRRQGAPVLIDWGQRYSWILVGGLAMDRGFTVEGLTVTYMPRGMGGGNADSMQQRARFFGYKGKYLGYCRVFLARDVKQGFEDYVEHEEFMRNDLLTVRDSADGLKDWPRRFVLDASLKPCRDAVLSDGYTRSAADVEGWAVPQAFMGADEQHPSNPEVVSRFVARHQFEDDQGSDRRLATHRHKVTGPIPLREVVDELITQYRVRDPGEADKWAKLGAMLGRVLDDDPEARAVVYQMSVGERRSRSISPSGRVKQLFQGAYPVKPPALQGSVYPGDRQIASDSMVTVQVHVLNLLGPDRRPVATGVPFLAVKLPANTGVLPLVTQVQAAQQAAESSSG
ncbi:Z1 domain-containing protein [Roseomonas mucosa]